MPSWTTCISCRPQPGHGSCTTWLEKNCSPCRGSSFTQGRQGAGIAWDSLHPTWRCWAQRCGAQEGSRFSARRWAQRNSSRRRPIRGSRKNAGCGRPSSGYLICSALGKSSCNVPVLGATTLCGRCLLAILRLMRKVTTKACQEPWAPCWVAFREQKDSTRLRRCWQLCQCGWVGFAFAGYWASWADALPMISERLPAVATSIVTALENQDARGCLGELSESARRLDREGFVSRPDWRALSRGARPPVVSNAEPGEWQHGWQYHASSCSEHQFRETMVLSTACPSDQAHLRSHSGPGSSSFLLGAPTKPEFELLPEQFRTLVLERLCLLLNVVEARCECGIALDAFGRHRAACPRSGRLRSRAVPPERTLARTVRCNAKLRDMNVVVSASDERSIEVLASGLPFHHGAQLAIDVTLRSALTSCGNAIPGAARENGAALARARPDKERKFAELLEGDRCHLVVVAPETGGRWSSEALELVESLASARAREAPPILRRSAHLAWARRCGRMLSVSCARSFANSLTSPTVNLQGTDGPVPDLFDLFS